MKSEIKREIGEWITARENGEYFDTVYYNPHKPWWLPWRLWFHILNTCFDRNIIWMKILKERQVTTFARFPPMGKLEKK